MISSEILNSTLESTKVPVKSTGNEILVNAKPML